MANHGVRVDNDGIFLPGSISEPLDIFFGGHRVWSFSAHGDGQHVHGGTLVPWPTRVRKHLDGVTEVTVVPHPDGAPVFDATVAFGTSPARLELLDDAGNRISVDKNGRLQRSFDRMDESSRAELVEAAHRVLVALTQECGLDAYLVYGCLLGAVRTGRMIGHDTDVDLAWLSRHDHPFDVIRESKAAERTIAALGWRVMRMSAANFKVLVPLPSGKSAGVDVFGSFHLNDTFHLTGNLIGELPREAMLPFGTVNLEGVDFPAPADLDAFLSFTYGPSWRVPDPAFHFAIPEESKTVMNQLLRTGRAQLWHWQPFYRTDECERVPKEPSRFAHWVADRLPHGSRIVELGSGTGRDAVWLAGQGFDVHGSDFSLAARSVAKKRARQAKVPVQFTTINVNSQRSLLVNGARLAHQPGVKHVYARLMVDALASWSRPGLWRFCSMVGRSGGHTFVEFRTDANRGTATFFGPHSRYYAEPDAVVAEIESYGGRVLDRVEGRDLAPLGRENPVVCRMEVGWTS